MNTHDLEQLSRFIDGELDANERAAVTALLDVSDEAKATLNELNEFNALAAQAFPRMRFRRPVLRDHALPKWTRYAAAAAALVVVALGGLAYAAYEAGWLPFGNTGESVAPARLAFTGATSPVVGLAMGGVAQPATRMVITKTEINQLFLNTFPPDVGVD